jgi:hypothetical protein
MRWLRLAVNTPEPAARTRTSGLRRVMQGLSGDTCQTAEAVKTTKRAPPSRNDGRTTGPPGLVGDSAVASPALFSGLPGWALRRHRNVTKDRTRGFGPASNPRRTAHAIPTISVGYGDWM